MARLVFVDGKQMGKAVVLTGADSLGRATGNTIVFPEATVQDRHAVIHLSGGAYRLSRAHPSATVSINGKSVAEETLRHGDLLSIGDVTLLFSEEAPSPAPASRDDSSKIHSTTKPFADPQAAVEALRKGRRVVAQLETLYRVGSAINSTLRLDDLVEQILMHVAAVFKPDRCCVFLKNEDDQLVLQGQRASERSLLTGHRSVSKTILNRVIEKKESVHTESALEDERFSAGMSVTDQQIQSALCAPIIKNDQILGVLYLDTLGSRSSYESDDLFLINAIAAQAATAVDNVRRHDREVAYGRALVRLGESSRRVSSFLSREQIVKEAVEQASAVFECARATVLLADAAGRQLTLAATVGGDPVLGPEVPLTPGQGPASRVFQEARPLLVTDATPSAKYRSASYLIAPIISRGEGLQSEARPIGVLCVTDRTTRSKFTPHDEELLLIFASHVGIALNNAQLFERATVDALTRLRTRQYFNFRFEEEVRSHQERRAPLSLLMCDLDHFKQKNDTYGHPVGDVILSEAAAILKEHVPPEGIAARYGGEEFVAVLPSCPIDRARALAETICRAVEKFRFNARALALQCTVSIGAGVLQPGEPPAAFLQRTDAALYAAKHSGRNRVEVAPPPA